VILEGSKVFQFSMENSSGPRETLKTYKKKNIFLFSKNVQIF
jgi:hypothetical protein